MALVKLEIPPGLSANGTIYQNSGRWFDGNLVRWFQNTMRPVGGWTQMSSTQFADVSRGMLAYYDNSNARRVIVGTPSNLYVYVEGKNQSDITPAGIATGSVDATANTGYGAQFYGEGTYGTPRSDNETYTPCTTVTIDNFGENVVACFTGGGADGKIYYWQNDPATVAAVLTNAPTNNKAVLVTDERFVMALGADSNARKVQFSDQSAPTVWTPSATNAAGSFELASEGQIQAGVVIRGQILILTDADAHAVDYVGSPFYYTSQKVGSNCGIIAPKAIASFGTSAYWMGEKSFYAYDGGYTVPITSEVSDAVFTDLNQVQRSKIWAVVNGQYNECWWFYPSSGSTEVDKYVSFNFNNQSWAMGSLARTAGVDNGVFQNPIWASTDRYIYEHETGFSWDGATPFAESGALQIGDGERIMDVTGLIPDESNLGDTTVIFKTRMFPTGSETTSSSFSMANPTNVRLSARQVRIRVTSNSASDWRFGNMRIEVKPGSAR